MSYRPAQNGARRTRCRCGAPVLRQLVGRRAAANVTADDGPMTAAQADALADENRLAWCLRTIGGVPDLRWTDGPHTDCLHPHVISHKCTAPPTPARRQVAQPELF